MSALRPAGLHGGTRSFSREDMTWICRQFDLTEIAQLHEFGERGNINLHTYYVESESGDEFLLQRINSDVFRKPHRVMEAMNAWITAQRDFLDANQEAEIYWHPIYLHSTLSGAPYLDLSDENGLSVWRLMEKIPNCESFKSLAQLGEQSRQLAYAKEMGRGLALSADFASMMSTGGLMSSLPGYRDTAGYFRQLHSVLAGRKGIEECGEDIPSDEEVRESTQDLYILHISHEEAQQRKEKAQEFIDIALEAESFGLEMQNAVDSGLIRKTAIHGDTKIENFLFCRDSSRVKSLVDLDTIMPYTFLADWGDMVRSLVNVAGEKEANLDWVNVDREVYEAVLHGFLSTASSITPQEKAMLVDAVPTIALELGIRFLTDYLRGDNYFCLLPTDPPELNLIRGAVQITLYQRLREQEDWAKDLVASL